MKRVIRFRAWDKAHECYLYDVQGAYDMLSGCVKYENGEDAVYDEECFAGFLDNDQYVVEQYTGLTDKNGREIYESDIVRVQETMDGGRIVCLEAIASVFWNKERGCWGCEGEFEGHLADYAFGTELNMMGNVCEVVGNIYENPELMEVAEHD